MMITTLSFSKASSHITVQTRAFVGDQTETKQALKGNTNSSLVNSSAKTEPKTLRDTIQGTYISTLWLCRKLKIMDTPLCLDIYKRKTTGLDCGTGPKAFIKSYKRLTNKGNTT